MYPTGFTAVGEAFTVPFGDYRENRVKKDMETHRKLSGKVFEVERKEGFVEVRRVR
jgi:hypothetical protein